MTKTAKTFTYCILAAYFLCPQPVYAKPPSPLQVTFIDVGHGDCTLIQTPDDDIKGNGKCEGKTILIDAGEASEGAEVAIPYLEAHGVTKDKPIDFLVMTHAHSDHLGGLIPVIKHYQVKAVLDPGYEADTDQYAEFKELAEDEPNCTYYCPLVGTLIQKVGDNLDWGSELEVKVMHSDKDTKKLNNSSIVIRLKYGEISFLLDADAEGKERKDKPEVLKFAEKEMVGQYGKGLKSTFLKVGHHGSESSSTNDFIKNIAPQYAIICAGNKKFSKKVLPDDSVIKRYEAAGVKIYRTDRGDKYKLPARAAGDDHIVVTTDGSRRGTHVQYEE